MLLSAVCDVEFQRLISRCSVKFKTSQLFMSLTSLISDYVLGILQILTF